MKLYGSLTSPYTRKARIVIKEKSLDCEFIVEKPGEAGTRFTQLNPLEKVPVLEINDENVLFDSPVICEYLDQLTGEPLFPTSGEARWQTQRWQALADGIMDAVVMRLLEVLRPEQLRMDEAIEKQEKKIANALAALNSAVREREFLVGDSITMADLAVGVALEYIDLRYAHDWRNQFPALAFWVASISARPSFRETEPPGMENLARLRH
jgi:glutathione S-transferase